MTTLCLHVKVSTIRAVHACSTRCSAGQEHPLHATAAYANLVQGKDHALPCCLPSFNIWLRTVIIQTSVSGMDLVREVFSPSAACSHGAIAEISRKLILQDWVSSLAHPVESRSRSPQIPWQVDTTLKDFDFDCSSQ